MKFRFFLTSCRAMVGNLPSYSRHISDRLATLCRHFVDTLRGLLRLGFFRARDFFPRVDFLRSFLRVCVLISQRRRIVGVAKLAISRHQKFNSPQRGWVIFPTYRFIKTVGDERAPAMLQHGGVGPSFNNSAFFDLGRNGKFAQAR